MTHPSRPRTVPLEVKVSAALFGAFTAWRLFAGVLPSFLAGESNSGQELVSVVIAAWIVAGLLRLQPGARFFARFLAGLMVGFSLILLGSGAGDVVASRFAVEAAAVMNRQLAATAAIGTVLFLLLGTEQSRRAFERGGS